VLFDTAHTPPVPTAPQGLRGLLLAAGQLEALDVRSCRSLPRAVRAAAEVQAQEQAQFTGTGASQPPPPQRRLAAIRTALGV
jgi:hypothetical protein